MDLRCTFNVKDSVNDHVFFGTDYSGRTVVIKKISTVNPKQIDTYCRFNHPNLIHGFNVLVPEVCHNESVLIMTEPGIYTLEDIIKFEKKDSYYFMNADKYSRDLIAGMNFLHKNLLIHNNINPSNCLLKLWEDEIHACLNDFKLVNEYTELGESKDRQNLGYTIVELYTLEPVSDVNSSIRKYKEVFKNDIPYRNLLNGQSYDFHNAEFSSAPNEGFALPDRFNTIFCEIIFMTKDSSIEHTILCLHNLYRHACRMQFTKVLPDLSAMNIIKFTDYCMGLGVEGEFESIVNRYIFDFSGVLLPTTVYHTAIDFEDLIHKIKLIFNTQEYSKNIDKFISMNSAGKLYRSDLANTDLYDCFETPEDYLF